MHSVYRFFGLLLLNGVLLSVGCRGAPAEAPALRATAVVSVAVTRATQQPSASPTSQKAPATPTPMPTSTSRPSPTASATPEASQTPTITPTPVTCSQRRPPDTSLLVLVNRDFGLSREYTPGDLVPLSDHFPQSITLGYPTQIRLAIVEPLQEIIDAMVAEGLAPQVISAYRDYSAQALALEKWLEQYPDWARNLSAPPGHSEHQLGTTVDFGSPELPQMVGEENIQFHPAFAQTSEGQWLAEHAPSFGFTMSYPADAQERTAFFYEPWHFRYVGREVALLLRKRDLTLTEYLLEINPQPCIP